MKLRNKLIPLATVFATSATLAPVVLTSCAGGLVDLTDGNYKPNIKQAVIDGYKTTNKEGFELWMAAVNENPEILKQDLYWGLSHYVKGFNDVNKYTTTKLQAKVDNVSVKYITVKDVTTEEDVTIPTATFDLDFVYEMNRNNKISTETGTLEHTLYVSEVTKTSYKNIPIAMNLDIEEPENASEEEEKEYIMGTDWKIVPDAEALINLDANEIDWQFTVKSSITKTMVFNQGGQETSLVNSGDLNRSYKSYADLYYNPKPDQGEIFKYKNGRDLLNSIYIYSYYLMNIKNTDKAE